MELSVDEDKVDISWAVINELLLDSSSSDISAEVFADRSFFFIINPILLEAREDRVSDVLIDLVTLGGVCCVCSC